MIELHDFLTSNHIQVFEDGDIIKLTDNPKDYFEDCCIIKKYNNKYGVFEVHRNQNHEIAVTDIFEKAILIATIIIKRLVYQFDSEKSDKVYDLACGHKMDQVEDLLNVFVPEILVIGEIENNKVCLIKKNNNYLVIVNNKVLQNCIQSEIAYSTCFNYCDLMKQFLIHYNDYRNIYKKYNISLNEALEFYFD